MNLAMRTITADMTTIRCRISHFTLVIDLVSGPAAQPKANDPQLFNANLCEISPIAYELLACDEILHVHGIPVDTIEEVGSAWDLGLAVMSTFRHGDRENSRAKAHEVQISIIENWETIARIQQDGVYPLYASDPS